MKKQQFKKKLFCSLVNGIVTASGDFIPAGSPVQVLQWGSGEKVLV